MEPKVGQLYFSKGSLFRVISVGSEGRSMTVLEYSSHLSDYPEKCLTQIKDVWYQWKNGVGEKIQLSFLAVLPPNKIPQPVHAFSQLDNGSSFIIKGTAYKLVENATSGHAIPEKWSGNRIIFLTSANGKKNAMISLEQLERKTIFDKAANCEFSVDGTITRLNEQDIWIITEA